MADHMIPVGYRVVARSEETADTTTLTLAPDGPGLAPWHPGQFTMVYAFGVGEIPLSISGGDPRSGRIRHTVRAVGATSRAIQQAPVGAVLGLRGPHGQGWPDPPAGADVVILAGGIGLAPLRPVVLAALDRPGRLSLLVGARTPADLIFTGELEAWRQAGAQVLVTVDRAATGWTGHVGVVTDLLAQATFEPAATVAYVCGPEVMMWRSAQALAARDVAADRIAVSLERNMQCGVAECGRCQLGPLLVCRDGPVVWYDTARPLLATKEL
jgi:NAD(P)H-flavin reductase